MDPTVPGTGPQRTVQELTVKRERRKRIYPEFPKLHCIVKGCDTRPGSTRATVFSFPRCNKTSKLWRRALGIGPEDTIRQVEGVCSLHFEEAFLVRDEDDTQNVQLMPGAIPDLDTVQTLTPGANHCRMCGSPQKKVPDDKVSVLRRNMEMLPVLDICLDLNGPANPNLPDGVCEACTSMVRFITKFAKSCWNAQELLVEKYAPGMDYKFEPWKRLPDYTEEPTEEEYPLVEVIPEPEPEPESKPTPFEDTSESEMIELIPFEEVKQELQLEIATPECPEKVEETPPTPPLPPATPTQPKRQRSSQKKSTDLYKCDFCTLKFSIKRHLDLHIRTHVRNLVKAERNRKVQIVGQFRCLRCRAQFSLAEQLKAHFAAQHQDKIQCRECNLTFNYDSLLEKHNAQVHPERATKKGSNLVPKNGSNATSNA